MIEVENLTKVYGKHMALDHVTFQLDEGKIYGFLGPNGAGKSTTMNIMTGYIAPSEGTVRINGFDMIKDAQVARQCIGYLPEIPPVYPDMTVAEFLTFAAEIKKIPKKERKTQMEEVMQMTGIADMGHRLIRNLSKGYRQRVGFAQAILGYPDIIILDEPTVGLDPKQIIEIRELIRKLGEKHTVILSSHILSEVQAVCDEIMIISKGKMVARGTSEELIHQMEKDALLELEVEGTPQELTELLQQFEKVESFELVEGERPEITKVKIHTSAENDIRHDLFFALADARMPILSLCRKEDSLEEAFLELTGEAAMKETLEQEKSGKAGSFLHRKKKESDSDDFEKTTDHDREDQEPEKQEDVQGGEEDAGNL